MPQIKRTQRAKYDAIEIWAYIAKENEAAADKVIDQIDDRIKSLSFLPLSGAAMTFIAPDVRRTVVGRYSIYYRPVKDGIEVLRILHERRDHVDLV